jgi:hypothetical protein
VVPGQNKRRVFYQVQLDKGESRWAPLDQFRKAEL